MSFKSTQRCITLFVIMLVLLPDQKSTVHSKFMWKSQTFGLRYSTLAQQHKKTQQELGGLSGVVLCSVKWFLTHMRLLLIDTWNPKWLHTSIMTTLFWVRNKHFHHIKCNVYPVISYLLDSYSITQHWKNVVSHMRKIYL